MINDSGFTECTASKHGRKRIKERIGVGGSKAADRQAQLARERGLHHADTSGRLHKWITSRWGAGGKDGRRYIVYNRKLFIFTNDYSIVVTVYEVPNNLCKLVDTQTKRAREKVLAEE